MVREIEILGVRFHDLNREELHRKLFEFLCGENKGYLVTPNPYMVELAMKDECFKKVLSDADLCIADGVGIELACRILNKRLVCRIPGIEIGECVLSMCSELNISVYFLGGEDGVADRAAFAMCEKYSGLQIAGCHHGYFKNEQNDKIVEEINTGGAQVLFVCLGAPKQEKWIADNIYKLRNVRLALCLGGSLDVYSGKKTRAPLSIRRCGLEWLWRAFGSYRHLKRLYHIPVFMYHILLETIKKNAE